MLNCFINKMTIPFMMVIFAICIYFYVEWRTKKICDHKIKKILQNTRTNDNVVEKIETPELGDDIDSYIDPAQIYDK